MSVERENSKGHCKSSESGMNKQKTSKSRRYDLSLSAEFYDLLSKLRIGSEPLGANKCKTTGFVEFMVPDMWTQNFYGFLELFNKTFGGFDNLSYTEEISHVFEGFFAREGRCQFSLTDVILVLENKDYFIEKAKDIWLSDPYGVH